ncbi:hypothetical protein [Kribbella sp. DT2]|uniref:hypothetical protein n=1 Tax=Kribbella sp. DT2 TaxID=3393427 RepID=UPI003CF093FC
MIRKMILAVAATLALTSSFATNATARPATDMSPQAVWYNDSWHDTYADCKKIGDLFVWQHRIQTYVCLEWDTNRPPYLPWLLRALG